MKKDITTNNLIENNDVFADIANVNLWNGDILLKPEDLESVPINTSYKDIDGKHHQLFRDNLKRVKNRDGCIAFLGCEAQTSINNVMPVRNMGYNYTVYMRQIQKLVSENNRRKHSAYAKVLHDNQKLLPVATFVLYFGNEKWQHPLSLMDILDIPEENKKFWRQLIHDYKITVIPMADQPEEIRAKYQSDYKIIADYLALHKNKKELMRHLRKDQREIIHVEQLLDMLRALSGDRRFDTIKEYYVNNENKEECNKMCLLLDMCEQEGIRKGRKEGIRKGRKKGIQEGIFLFQKALRLEANGKTKKEIAKELKISLAMVENILGTGHLSS